MRLKFLPENF